MELKNRVALITGSAHRVGKEIAQTLAREKVKIALHFNSSSKEAEKTLQEISQSGGEAILLEADLSRISGISHLVEKTISHFSRIDILINNAAVYYKTPLHKITESDWDNFLTVNLKAPFFCCQMVSEYMKKQRCGKIINITDVAGFTPWSEFLPYSISKAGLISMTKGLAIALAPDIQVNAIASGTVLMGAEASEEYLEQIRKNTLLNRIGSPNDIAQTVLFLLRGTDYMTGTVVTVDGGKLLAS